jgi:hypothetical protein
MLRSIGNSESMRPGAWGDALGDSVGSGTEEALVGS